MASLWPTDLVTGACCTILLFSLFKHCCGVHAAASAETLFLLCYIFGWLPSCRNGKSAVHSLAYFNLSMLPYHVIHMHNSNVHSSLKASYKGTKEKNGTWAKSPRTKAARAASPQADVGGSQAPFIAAALGAIVAVAAAGLRPQVGASSILTTLRLSIATCCPKTLTPY